MTIKHCLKRSPAFRLRLWFVWLLAFTLVWEAATPFALAVETPSKIGINKLPPKATKAASLVLQAGSSIIAYGPQRFDYEPGPARTQYTQFTLAMPVAGILRVQNGTTGSANRATGAIVQLNGTVLTTARNFNLSTATLDIPVNLFATNALSVRVVGAPGSYLTITVLAKPIITMLSPASAVAGATININGNYFDDSGLGQNLVRFAKEGGGQTTAQVTAATATQLSVIVPADAATGPVTVQTAAGTATSPTNFVLVIPPPVIADFTPKRGTVGATVTLTGTHLKVGMANPTVTFAGANNTRLPALVTSATPGQVLVTVPNAAITGTIELTTSMGTAATIPFFVDSAQDFQITAAPSTGSAVQGSSADYVISLTSEQSTFTQLASLSVQGAPAGSTITFTPQQITAGATSTLNLRVAANLAPGDYPFTISATADIDGASVVRTVQATINVLAAGTTTLSGRVLSTKDEPVPGATVSLDGFSATTNAAGNFLLSGIAAGANRPVMVDGRTASAPNRTYPVIAEPVTVVAGQANVVPYIFRLPAIDTANEVTLIPTQATIVTTPAIPGVALTVPANAGLVNRDGTPVTRVSLTMVEPDRTPAPLPSNVGTNIVYTAQPGGARPSPGVKIPVTYPNLAGANPGTRVELWNFNHDTVQWYIYGHGNVSADGRLIVPEPGVGLPDFSWHFPNLPGGCDGGNCSRECPSPVSPNPVDLSAGVKIEKTTDVTFGGARGRLELTRIYTSNRATACTDCPFGIAMTHNYAVRLSGTFMSGGAGRIIYPEEQNGRLFSFDVDKTAQDPQGALVFTTTATPHQLGDVIRKLTDGTFEYRAKNGNVMRFDTSGRLIAMVDRNGNTTTFTYTGSNLTQITDAVSRSLTLQYSGPRITSVTDPLGRVWQYGYDGSNRLITVTDPLNQTMTYTYSAVIRLASITDKRGNVMKQITYDANGRVSQQQFADGGIESYSYTLNGNMVFAATLTDPLGRTRSMRFNGAGQVVGMTDELGQSSTITRDLMTNLPLQRSGPCGCPEDTRTYDGNGNPLAITNRLGQTTHYEYEPVFNNVTRMTDRLGRVTTFTYDAQGNRTSMINALTQPTTYAYDQFGQLTSMTDALNHTRQMEYDARGHLTALVDALGNRSTMENDFVGRLMAMVDPLGRRTEMTYDALNRTLTSKAPSNAVTTFAYDGNGNRISLTDALNHQWVNRYDKKNRLITSIDPINRATRYAYDAANQMLSVTSPSKRKVSYAYDARGQRTMITDAIGGITRHAYDNRGNQTALTDQRNNTTTFAYDELFRLVTQTDPLGRRTNFAYDAADNIIATVDRLGRSTSTTYDALNRRQRVSYADATVDYTYDAAGRMTHIADTQGGTIDLSYDNANRLLSEQTAEGLVSYTYNQASQRATMTAANAPVVTYAYDAAGRLSTITQGSETFTYTYDTLSLMQSLQRPNGVMTTYQYDNVNRLARLTHASASATIEDLQYAYNIDDEISAIISLASGTLLTTAKTASAADAANRIPQFGAASYVYDLEGQTTNKSDAQGLAAYNWDARGRLTSVVLPGGQTISYSYDARGRRKSRMADSVTTSFLHDGLDVVRDTASSGGVIDYLNGQRIDQKLRQTGSGGPYYFLHDHLNSTVAVTNASGGIAGQIAYEAYGAETSSLLTRYRYTGRELDTATRLMYYRARWYETDSGRFISEDPIGISSVEPNLYRYVSNNPINKTDSLGLHVDLHCQFDRSGEIQCTQVPQRPGLNCYDNGNGRLRCDITDENTRDDLIDECRDGDNEACNVLPLDCDRDDGRVTFCNQRDEATTARLYVMCVDANNLQGACEALSALCIEDERQIREDRWNERADDYEERLRQNRERNRDELRQLQEQQRRLIRNRRRLRRGR